MSRSDALKAATANWPALAKTLSGPQGAMPASDGLPDGSVAPSSVAPPETGANVGGNTDSASSETPSHG